MTNNSYTYQNLLNDIKNLFPSPDQDTNPRALHTGNVFSIGKSVQGRDILAFKLGAGTKRILFCGGFHGMESVTSGILFALAKNITKNSALMSDSTALYIVPMVNPDGIEIASKGKRWQANARGVDLNHNFDALWDLSKQLELSHGITSAGPTRYGGEFPESEPESKALADFTRQNSFDMAIALHSQGEVIYYDFCGNAPDGTEEYLKKFESVSNYRRDSPAGIASYGGYKDWFIKRFKRPAFTIEVGLGENPLPMSDFDKIYRSVEPILLSCI